jgi:hypothetical protein
MRIIFMLIVCEMPRVWKKTVKICIIIPLHEWNNFYTGREGA